MPSDLDELLVELILPTTAGEVDRLASVEHVEAILNQFKILHSADICLDQYSGDGAPRQQGFEIVAQ